MKTEPVHLHLPEGDYVLIPRAEYLRLCGQQQPEGVPVAEAKLGVTQARVSRAESGTVSLSSAFFARVHKACKLPRDWLP